MYASLHNHTQYSNLKLRDSINRIPDMVKRAIDYGFNSLAITDHEVLSGHIEALEVGDKIREEHPDFKIILGNEIYLIREDEYKNAEKYWHFILLARTKAGHKILRQLSTRAWERSYVERGQRRCPTFIEDLEELVKPNQGDIIASTACLGGYLPNRILAHNTKDVAQFLTRCVNIFGKENFFLEMQDSDTEEQQIVNRAIVKISAQTGIPYIITQDAHYDVAESLPLFSAFLNSKEEKDREVDSFYKYTYMKTEDEMKKILSYLPAEDVQRGIDNTQLIYNRIEHFDLRSDTLVPQRKLPEGFEVKHLFKEWYEKYPFVKQYAYAEDPQDRFLMYLIERGVEDKKLTLDEAHIERINRELDILSYSSGNLGQPLSAYLNLVQEIVALAWQVSFVGVGRGSAASWLINYLIGITDFDPLPFNLPEWRFLNKATIPTLTEEEKKEVAEGKRPPLSVASYMMDIDEDYAGTKSNEIMEIMKDHYGRDRVLNTLTYKRESLKSAIQTACRGLGISSDESREMSAMVPMSRGHVYTLKECEEGDEEKGFEKEPRVIEALKKYPSLYETVAKVENLISGAGVHASAVYIAAEPYIEHLSMMRAPNGTPITCYDYRGDDSVSLLKVDYLYTDVQSRLMKCMELMLKDNVIRWQGSLRETYKKYFHPDVLDYNNEALWDALGENRIPSIFQFDSPQGSVCIRRTKPRSVKQLSAANAVMRLMGQEGKETPLDRYVRFRNNINEWYKEMDEWGLTEEEQTVLKEEVADSFGIGPEQEDFIKLLMRKEVANFTQAESNWARKSVSKKKLKEIEKLKKKFFENAEKPNGPRRVFLDYIFQNIISSQLGYSFSAPHDCSYSIEAVQEATLATRYNPLYWRCACLSVDAGSSDTNMVEEYGDEDETEEQNDEVAGEAKEVTADYGKISKAVAKAQQDGTIVAPADINKSQLDFYPDTASNSIIYSLKAVTSVNTELANRIIAARPFSSLIDFLARINPTNVQAINMIKAGCFDSLYPPQTYRKAIMEEYVNWAAAQKISRKEKLTMANLDKIIDFGLLPPNLEISRRVWKYSKFMKEYAYDKKNRRYTVNKSNTLKFFQDFYEEDLTIGKDYDTIPDGYSVKSAPFNKLTDKFLDELKGWLSSFEACDLFYKAELKQKHDEIWEKYCTGSVSKWEMQSLHYYYHEHELAHVNLGKYGIVDFDTLPETLTPTGTKVNRNGVEVPTYDLVRICGTVINSDNNKHIVTILTNFGKVVDVKFYSGSYIYYNKVISYQDEKGVKHRVEGSWFDRGNLLCLSGVRRELSFLPKTDWSKGYRHSVELITSVLDDGTLLLKEEREKL